jgi:hypothetical protein
MSGALLARAKQSLTTGLELENSQGHKRKSAKLNAASAWPPKSGLKADIAACQLRAVFVAKVVGDPAEQ